MGKMEKITKEEVKRIAELARIKISDEEAIKMEKDFEEILSYFSEIEDKGSKESKIKSHMFEGNTSIREDVEGECNNNIISQFSQLKGRYAKAPKSLKE